MAITGAETASVFAEQAEGSQFRYGSAYLDYLAENNANRVHTDTWNPPPPGALGLLRSRRVSRQPGTSQCLSATGKRSVPTAIPRPRPTRSSSIAVTAITNPALPRLGISLRKLITCPGAPAGQPGAPGLPSCCYFM